MLLIPIGRLLQKLAPRGFVGFNLVLLIFIHFLMIAAPSLSMAAGRDWHTDLNSAKLEALDTGNPILAVFTGSDWCPHCRTLEESVLSQEAFLGWAERNVVLLLVDIPQQGISASEKAAKVQIARKYRVSTFPTVHVITSDGELVIHSKTGYQGQSAERWTSQVASAMPARKVARIQAPPVIHTNTTTEKPHVHDSLDAAVASAKQSQRPLLLVVSRPDDSGASTHSTSLISDPEFDSFAHDHFVIAHIAPPEAFPEGQGNPEGIHRLVGTATFPPEAVEIIVTDDGQVPLFSESGSQPTSRIVNGLKRFLAARAAARAKDPDSIRR